MKTVLPIRNLEHSLDRTYSRQSRHGGRVRWSSSAFGSNRSEGSKISRPPNKKRRRTGALQNLADVGAADRIRTSKCRRAFSLIEVMIALLILGVALVGFVQGTTTALSSSKDAEVQTTAIMLASGQMEQVRADGELEDGETDGDWGDDYPNFSWKQTIAPSDVRGLHEVSVLVEDARSGKQLYELRTMLFEVPPATDEDSSSASKKKKRKGAEE